MGRRGGGRRERGESMGDGERNKDKCIRVRVFFLCVCVQGYVHVDV